MHGVVIQADTDKEVVSSSRLPKASSPQVWAFYQKAFYWELPGW